MAIQVRNFDSLILRVLLDQYNRSRADAYRRPITCHADASPPIRAVDATDLPSGLALANAIKASLNVHVASVCNPATGLGAHLAADAANAITAPDATDEASLDALVTQLVARANAHFGSTVAHPVADTANTITGGVDNPAAVLAPLNQVKAKVNAHFALAMQAQAIQLVSP